VLVVDGNSEHLSWQNDPFREDFTAVPYEEELRERARIVLEHNEDALRLHVEILLEELSDRPQLRKEIVIPILCCASTLIEPGFIRAPAFSVHLPPGTWIHIWRG
jgi:uncharacterized protein (UPF0276 family)